MHDIDVLRALRDTWLMKNAFGMALVDVYYHVSPGLADWVAQSPLLASLVRVALVPVILAARLALAIKFLPALLATSIVIACARLRHKKTSSDPR
ncbi:MAG TPA: hypothetical protein ENN80_08145 [Candidatus Hydrogenedentes bacterium]|nr:hypothetical protein [Candidatus Hydrogenedentota bacterium]